MRFSDIVKMCLDSLRRRKGRTILTVLGVFIGCTSIIVMVSIGAGMKESQDQMIATMGDVTVIEVYANGDVKERVFETTLSAMAMERFDPGEWEDPMEPIEEPSSFPWWIVAVVLAVITIIVVVVVSKKKKKEKLAKQQELWDDWDDDDGAGKAIDTTEAKPLPEAAATEEATK